MAHPDWPVESAANPPPPMLLPFGSPLPPCLRPNAAWGHSSK